MKHTAGGGVEGEWRGRGSDITARWLTSGAPGQVSCRDLEGPGSLCSESAPVSYTSLGLRASGIYSGSMIGPKRPGHLRKSSLLIQGL